MAFGLNIGDLLLTLLADGSMLQKDIEAQGIAAANAAGPAIGSALGSRIATGLTKSGKAMSTIGKSMTQNVTVPIIAAGTAITLVGVKFDTTLRRIVALTDITSGEIGGIKEQILALSTVVGKSPQELAEAFYFLASGGFNASESMSILTASAKAAAAGLGQTQDVAKVIGSSIHAFGKENLDATAATDQLIRAIQDGVAEAPDFAGALGDVVGSAGLLGAKFSDTAGAMAAMTLVGINADEAATSLNQVFRALIKTTPQAAKGFASVGLTVAGLKDELKTQGLLAVLETLQKAFEGNDVAAGQAFGNVRALRGVLALLGEHLPDTARILNDVAGGATNLGTAFDETNGPGRKMDIALTKMNVTLIRLSDDVLPVVVELFDKVATYVQRATDWFKQLDPGTRSAAVRIAALAAALGPLVYISGKVVSGLGGIVTGVLKLGGIGLKVGGLLADGIGLGIKGSQAIGSALGTAIDAVTANPVVKGALNRVGAFMGTTLGKAIGVTIAVVLADQLGKAGVNAATDALSGAVADAVAKGDADSLAKLKEARAALQERVDSVAALPFKIVDIGGVRAGWEKSLADMDAGIAAIEAKQGSGAPGTATHLGQAMADDTIAAYQRGILSGQDPVDKAIYGLTTTLPAATKKLSAAALAAGKNIPESIATGIIAEQDAPVKALEILKGLMKTALTPAARIGRDIGILLSKTLAAGLKDKRDVVHAEAIRTRDVAEKDLAELILKGGKVGKKASEELAQGLHSRNPRVRAAAKRVKAIVTSQLDATVGPAGRAGTRAGDAFANNLRGAVSSIGTFRMDANFQFRSGGHASGGPETAGMPRIVGERGQEIFVPSTNGYTLSHSDAMKIMSGEHGSGNQAPLIGTIIVNPGSDVSTAAARRFGVAVMDEVANGLKRQRARTPGR